MKKKINLKLVVALIIMLLVGVFNMNTVNATTDQEYVKSLKLTSPKYYEVDLDFLANAETEMDWQNVRDEVFNIIGEYYTKQINDEIVTATSESGGTDGGLNFWTFESGTDIQIFRNDVLCDTRTMGREFTIPVINVPSTVEDAELNNYLKELITKSYKDFGEGITKIEKGTKDVAGIEITNGYTITSDYGMESCIIVKKENNTDKQYVENLLNKICTKNASGLYSITTTKYFELGESSSYNFDISELESIINDSSISVIENGGGYGGGGSLIFSIIGGSSYDIYKNNVKYNSIDWEKIVQAQITIPNSVEDTETAYIGYATSKISTYLKTIEEDFLLDENGINKDGTITLKKANENRYKIYCDEKYVDDIILKKEENKTVSTTDNKTNIKLNADTTVVPENTVLETKEVKEVKTLNIVKETLKEISTKYTTYDITLKSEGVAIQPNGKVQISIPIPSDYDKTKLTVLRVADDGTKTEYDTKVEGEFAVIETDHFSTYVLAEKNVTVTEVPKTEETAPKGEKDDTPKTGTVEMIYYILPVMIISALGIIAFRKKENK